MSYGKEDLLKWITVTFGVVTVCLFGLNSCTHYNTQVNEIERICYERGGHMTAAPGSSNYMTCKGPNNQWIN
jgi:hypothetical protein